MAGLMGVLAFAGAVCLFIGAIMFLVVAFRQSVLWGLAILFIPCANFVFLAMHWSEAKKAFLIQLLGLVMTFIVLGIALSTGAWAMYMATKSGAIPMPQKIDIQKLVRKSAAIVQEAETDSDEAEDYVDMSDDFVGMKLEEVKNILGAPKARLKTATETILFYGDIEIVSTNGITVTSQGAPADNEF